MGSARPDVVTLEAFLPFVEEMLDAEFNVHRLWQSAHRDEALDAQRDKARAIAAFGHNLVDGALLDRLPGVKIVSLMSVGYDRVDLTAARERGIAVTNTPDVLTDDVADLALALTLAASRRVTVGDRYVRAGGWLTGNMGLTQSITGKTLGILGLGRIGTAIARRAEAFRMKPVYGVRARKQDAPWPFYDDLVAMAETSDILVVSIPGGASTRHMVDATVLEALGPDGILVNVARGTVVDEAALIAALGSGALGGAGLDVFEDEPNVPRALMDFDRVVLQPHVGSATFQTRTKMAQLMLDNLRRFFAGKPLLTPVS